MADGKRRDFAHMNDTIPLQTRSMTPDEVLSRLTAWADESDSGVVGRDSDLYDLAVLVTDDLQFWPRQSALRELGRLIEELFDIRIEEWETDRFPPVRRTVGELCERIASAVEVVVPQPVTVLGRPCLSAGAFLAIRTLLAKAGADASAIAPSSPLTPLVCRFPGTFSGRIVPMMDGPAFVLVSAAARRADRLRLLFAVIAVFGGLILLAAATPVARFVSFRLSGACIAGGIGCFWFVRWCLISSRELVRQVELPGLHDFRDLVNRILNRPPGRVVPSETLP
jgi:hypothetical protein